ncbi:MAG TPA: 4Fe-4S dicluster domain-containing protein [Anaerolineae bacterium]|nr:4Fe-4S dicluster domain-containing protein [Anaerolineae bacterium]
MTVRKIVHIDEERCNGCGLCVSPCVEGAIEIVDGKAKVIKEELCDGAGFCLGTCPMGALTIVEREAETFSEEAVHEHNATRKVDPVTQHCHWCGAADTDRPLLPTRFNGESVWVCVRCLPPLIHG